ncbi:MAG: acyl--CoA ligase [Oscillospiraceae bacterium]|nr:acyl--CoA ligase [Oscillospiraceae bacterium]
MTFENVFQKIIKGYLGKEFLTYYENGVRTVLTSQEYVKKTDAIACSLECRMKEIPKDSWVGIKVANDAFWFATFFGLLKIGYNVVLLDNNYSESAIYAFIKQAHIKAIVSDRTETYQDVLMIPYQEIRNVSEGTPQEICWASKLSFCTSGTTSNAKMYVFYAKTVDYQAVNIADYYINDEEAVSTRGNRTIAESYFLLTQPFRHCLGFGLPLAFWCAGFPCVMAEKPGIYGIAESCQKDRIWMFISVPAVWKTLLQIAKNRYGDMTSESMKKVVGETLTMSASAGAILDEVSAARLKQLDIKIMNGWGMTETGFVTIGEIKAHEELDYVGHYYNKHHAMVKNSAGELVEEGNGELYINGKAMYDAILVDGKEIQRDRDAYFATGDIFELHGNDFFFKGRCKSVIIDDTGENIYPEELDAHFALISDYDTISQFCTAEYENKPCLYISTKDYENFDMTEVFDYIVKRNSELPLGKRVTKIIATNLKLPVTGKAETARFFVKDFVTQHPEEIKTYIVKKKG